MTANHHKTRRELIEEAAAEADRAIKASAAVDEQLARFPRRGKEGKEAFDRAHRMIAERGRMETLEALEAVATYLKRRADLRGYPASPLQEEPKRSSTVVAVGELEDDLTSQIFDVVGPRPKTPRRGAPSNNQLLFDLVVLFRRMQSEGVEPPRRHINHSQAAYAPLWALLGRHGLLSPDGITAAMAETFDWASFHPAPKLLRRIENRMAHYFRRAHERL